VKLYSYSNDYNFFVEPTLLAVFACASYRTIAFVAIDQRHTGGVLVAFVVEGVTGIRGLGTQWPIPALLADATKKWRNNEL